MEPVEKQWLNCSKAEVVHLAAAYIHMHTFQNNKPHIIMKGTCTLSERERDRERENPSFVSCFLFSFWQITGFRADSGESCYCIYSRYLKKCYSSLVGLCYGAL